MRRLSLVVVVLVAAAVPATASGASRDVRFTASDGVSLQTTVTGDGDLAPRPTIVEFSPYGRDSGTVDAGSTYNYLLVQIRGTGDSDGRFDALGPRTQRDVAEVLRWACREPWSDGRLGLNGFSASAITIYNSLHLRLPCVKTAVLKSGTHELYRDLIYPGGINNLAPDTGVLALIGAPALAQGPDRAAAQPGVLRGHGRRADRRRPQRHGASVARRLVARARHPRRRQPPADADDRRLLRRRIARRVRGLPAAAPRRRASGRRRGARRRAEGHRRRGRGREGMVRPLPARHPERHREAAAREALAGRRRPRRRRSAGKFVRYDGPSWPIPGTRWSALALDPAPSGTAHSLNDGTLGLAMPAATTTQSYPAVSSLPSNSDPPNTAIVGASGVNALANAFPLLTEMTLAEGQGLSYTTRPLTADVLSAGPASLELRLSSTAGQTGIWGVISDVSPDGTPHPVASGRLNTDYPGIDRRRSLKDPRTGDIVQPYGRYDRPDPAAIGQERLYRVEFWPIGNRFKAGHRIRLHIVGISGASKPDAPAVNTIRVGGPQGARLLFPVLPGSDLGRALRGP